MICRFGDVLSSFLILQKVNPVTHSVGNCVKRVVRARPPTHPLCCDVSIKTHQACRLLVPAAPSAHDTQTASTQPD